MGSYTPPAVEPVVIEDYTAPQIYADGGNVRIGTETCHVIYFRVITVNGQIEHHEVARVILPRSAFDLALTKAWLMATGPLEKNGHKDGH